LKTRDDMDLEQYLDKASSGTDFYSSVTDDGKVVLIPFRAVDAIEIDNQKNGLILISSEGEATLAEFARMAKNILFR
jgi:hypothetical protein